MKTLLNIPYSKIDPEIRLIDIFLPEPETATGAGILFIHGGGWRGGAKHAWHSVMKHFCELGYTCASPEYHFAPKWQYPKQIEDVRLAMDFFRRNAAEYGFDPQRVGVWGSSSGGHLAALLAVTTAEDERGMSEEITDRRTQPAAAVCLCSVLTVHPYESHAGIPPMLLDFMGTTEDENPEKIRDASPIDLIRGTEPPFLMIVGDIDRTTPMALHQEMYEKLIAAGDQAQLIVLPGVDHGYGYGVESPAQKRVLTLAAPFLRKNL